MDFGLTLVQDTSGMDKETSTILCYILVSFVLIFLCGICYAIHYKCQCCCSSRVIEIGELEIIDGLGSNDLSKVQSLSFVGSNELPGYMEKFGSIDLSPRRSGTVIFMPTEAGETEFTSMKLDPVGLEAVNTEDCVE